MFARVFTLIVVLFNSINVIWLMNINYNYKFYFEGMMGYTKPAVDDIQPMKEKIQGEF